MKPVIIIHGGAWAIPDHLAGPSREGVKTAACRAYTILRNGGSAIDAVEAAITYLEDDPAFDAGKGSCLNAAGKIEMDASIMDGATWKAGAVAGVCNIANPIQLARKVMEETDHVLLVGEGANLFAEEIGIKSVDPSTLITETAAAEWAQYKKYKTAVNALFNKHVASSFVGHDTVGAVALDEHGNIAAATSTGGITGKRVGRVGDSPLIGSGTYCINDVGGVSCTGHGESIIKICLAKHVITLMDNGMDACTAVEKSLQLMKEKIHGAGGIICISQKTAEPVFHFTTERMAWAIARDDSLQWGLDPGEVNQLSLLPAMT